MTPKCRAQIQKAAGTRKLSDAKLQKIEDALSQKMSDLARQDRQRWQSLTREQRVAEAAKGAMDDIQAQAVRTEHLAGMQVAKTVEVNAAIAEQQAIGRKVTRSQAFARVMQNASNYVHAIHDEAVSGLKSLLDVAEAKDGTGVLRNIGIRIFNLDNPAMSADVVREIFRNADGVTGNKLAQTAARAWLDTTESLRVRFNAAGGDVGKLGYGYLSQAHDAQRIGAISPQAWAAKVLPLLDRNQYLTPEGRTLSDADLRAVLEKVHTTLASEGMNKVEPGGFKGVGKRANAGSQRRVLHFKDGDAWMGYMKEFGEGSLYDAMMGHVGKMSRNIGLVERFGPNPEQQFRLQADLSQRADGTGTLKNRAAGNTPQAYWDILSGKTSAPENETVANAFQDIRNVQTAAKLGSAVITSLTDVGTVAATLNYNRLPYFDMLKNLGRNITKDQREFLTAHGVVAEHLTGTMNRWTGDNMTHSMTGRVAASVMKLSFMNAWTDGLRSAFSATMMQGFAKKAGKSWAKLDDWDRWLMGRKGITEQDWDIISQAAPTAHNGVKFLTRQGVMDTGMDGAEQAATKWAAFVSDEAQFAVVNPDMATRAVVTGGGMPAGTLRGEAMRSFMQFKSFPFAMLTRHWGRVFDTPQGMEGAPAGFGAKTEAGGAVNRVAVLAGLNVSLMMLGAIVLQEKAIINGKDPYDMTDEKFWVRALSQGGGMGYVGDMLTKDPTEQRGNNFEHAFGSIAGPSGGAVGGLVGDLMFTNAWQAAGDKETNVGAEALRWTNSQLPYTSLWQIRGAWNNWFIYNAQEAINPGYIGRVRSRAMKDWGQDYYWPPGEALPDRAPDMGAAIGE